MLTSDVTLSTEEAAESASLLGARAGLPESNIPTGMDKSGAFGNVFTNNLARGGDDFSGLHLGALGVGGANTARGGSSASGPGGNALGGGGLISPADPSTHTIFDAYFSGNSTIGGNSGDASSTGGARGEAARPFTAEARWWSAAAR